VDEQFREITAGLFWGDGGGEGGRGCEVRMDKSKRDV